MTQGILKSMSIETDGPHKITEQRRWLSRKLLDSTLSDEEAFGIVAHHPRVSHWVNLRSKTAAEWHIVERTVYALQHEGWKRGVEQFVNRWSFYVQGGPGATDRELKAVAQLARSAPDLLEMVRLSASQFRAYERMHRAKGTPEADEKAEINAKMASGCEAAISRATESTGGGA